MFLVEDSNSLEKVKSNLVALGRKEKNAKWIWKIIRRRRAIDSIQNSSGQLGN